MDSSELLLVMSASSLAGNSVGGCGQVWKNGCHRRDNLGTDPVAAAAAVGPVLLLVDQKLLLRLLSDAKLKLVRCQVAQQVGFLQPLVLRLLLLF